MADAKCKICRRLGVSVCGREKCALKRKPYPPGQKKKKRAGPLSEYGKELREKQKLKNLYNLKEAQFRKYVKQILKLIGKEKESVSQLLINELESRLDNVIFRLGLASSRRQARQLVSHGHFLVNGSRVTVPSHRVKKGDVIKLKTNSMKKGFFQNISQSLKKQKVPDWLGLDVKNVEAKVLEQPTLEESALPVEIPVILEYYSR